MTSDAKQTRASVRRLTQADHPQWLALWHGYLEFYGAALDGGVTEATFQRLVSGDHMTGVVAAHTDQPDEIFGFAHFLMHASTWTTTNYCYLEDLFVAPQARRLGAGAALVEFVISEARHAGCTRCYLNTQAHNEKARALYASLGEDAGFVQYRFPLA